MTGSEKSRKWFLQERRLQSQKLAAIGELSAGIAHEINNPLAIIRQEAEIMDYTLTRRGGDAPDLKELQGSVRMIVQQVDRCTGIIRNLLNFARRREPVVQIVDLNRIIEDMTMLVEKEARNNQINIERHYDPELPLIFSDGPQLRQVILNLLTNASHAIGHDGTITIITRPGGTNTVEIEILDSGCGIPAKNLRKIFDPFFSTKPPGKGTGLGLSISHGLIRQLGGDIKVTSTVGLGTTFIITLPRQAKAEGSSS
jgi:two-component system, NtrC family, sensor kinase